MKGELYNYKGKWMTQAQIAREEQINRTTLSDWYKKTSNMEIAVNEAKKSLAQRNIEYYDEVLSLKAISVKEQLKFETLKKYFEECKDIYEAVKRSKVSKLKRNGTIEYNNKLMTIYAIANLENIGNKSLGYYYSITNDIYESVRLAKEAQSKRNGTILYKGKMMTISGIAKMEDIKRETLSEFYNIYGDINKAVFITKKSQLKRKKALLKGKMATYQQISSYFGLSTIKLDEMIKSGKKVDELERKTKKGKLKQDYLMVGDNSLYNFCLKHAYNYWVIYYMMNTYGRSAEEAIEAYLANGQQIPTKWIHEKYNILFKHLTLKFGLDSNRIIKIMKDENYNIEEAITRLIFISDNQNNEFKTVEVDWMHELYLFIKDLTKEEFIEAKTTFYITDRELNFIEEKSKKIEVIKRQLLLFEFSTIMDSWEEKDLLEMLELYGVTKEEMYLIITQLYSPFDQKIINPTTEYFQKEQMIIEFVTNSYISDQSIITNDDLSEQDKATILRKRQLISIFITNTIQKNAKKI